MKTAALRAPAAGFTLVEVLVAMMIMAIIAMMSWQGVDGVVRSRAASEERLEKTLRIQTVLAQWEQDLTAVQDSSVVPPIVFGGPATLMTRRTPDGLMVVTWSLRNGQLQRWASSPATTTTALKAAWAQAEQLIGQDAGQLRALSGVSDWQQYCFRGNAWSNCQSSGDAGQPVPDGVRLVLAFSEGSGFSGTVTRDISLGP
jgi:general secretion pathway protein J